MSRRERVIKVTSGREFHTDGRTNPVVLADEKPGTPWFGRRLLDYIANMFSRSTELIEYAYSDGCTSADDRHSIEDVDDSPFYAKCTQCHQRFYLVSESAMRRIGAKVVERPLRKVTQ